MNLSQLKKLIVQRLTVVVGHDEAEAMAKVIMEDIVGVSAVNIALNPEKEVETEIESKVSSVCQRVIKGEPLQYIIGSTLFHGIRLKVSPDVLIPRPETSGLVDIIADTLGSTSDLSVLDVCTGSGAIALVLARVLKFASITGVDISDAALEIAKENANKLNLRNVRFIQSDILKSDMPFASYDAIVSNPPYIMESEKKDIDARVLEYEPHIALFVPDDEPLLFYKRIINQAVDLLKSGGWLFFEINPRQAESLNMVLIQHRFEEVTCLRDFAGRYRYIKARRP